MTLLTKTPAQVFDPVDGTGAPRGPIMGEAATLLTEMVAAIDALESVSSSGSVVFATKAAMDASLAYPENQRAEVRGDGGNDGIYRKVGSSGSGSWSYVGPLPEAIATLGDNRFFGGAGNASLSGTNNTGLGVGAGDALTTGYGNITIGKGAGTSLTTSFENVAIGLNALATKTGGASNVAIGTRALTSAGVNADGNTAVGDDAGNPVTSGGLNTFLGFRAGLLQSGTLSETTVIGANAYAEENGQIALGSDTNDSLKIFGDRYMLERGAAYRSFYIGRNAGNRTHSGGANLGIGEITLQSITTADGCVAIGDFAMSAHITGSSNVAVGAHALRSSTGVIDCTAVGRWAMEDCIDGVGGTAIGLRAMQRGTSARNNTGVGDSALWQYQGSGSAALGYVVAEYWRTGDLNVMIGIAAGQRRGSGEENVLVGAHANSFPGQSVNTTTGDGGAAAGDGNVVVGYAAMLSGTGNANVVVGRNSGSKLTTGSNNVFVGEEAGNNGSQKVDATNSMALGNGAYTDANNQIVLGDANVVEIKTRGTAKWNIPGGQIQFPATQIASSDANTLDDYEEGSTTPTVTAATGTFTTVSCALDYTKIGNRVIWNATVTITNAGTASGEMLIPLPFTNAVAGACAGMSVTTFKAVSGRLVASSGYARVSLYDATTAIATGVTITVGGNYRV